MAQPTARDGQPDALGPEPSNDAEELIAPPYSVEVVIEGTSALLFHRWSNEGVAEKAKAAKGSRAKRTDDVETYIWRDDANRICLPGEYVRQAVVQAARYRQDPRSPRKSALDLFRAGVVPLTELAPIEGPQGARTTWDYLDERRVLVQRNAITRQRPAFNAGWRVAVQLEVLLPEYIEARVLHDVLINAGRFIGVGDFRPTYGRFQVVSFKTL
jgi:hypothetical protein